MDIERGGRNNHHQEFCDARRRCEFSDFMMHYKGKSGMSPSSSGLMCGSFVRSSDGQHFPTSTI